MSGLYCIATQVVALDKSMAFNRVWRAGKLNSYGISSQIFRLFSPFFSNVQYPVVLDSNSSRKDRVNAGVPNPTLFLLHFNDLLDDVICKIAAIYADDTTL